MAEVLSGSVQLHSHKVSNAGTIYQVAVIDSGEDGHYLMFSTGFSSLNHGEWVFIAGNEIAWSYLTEKCPDLAKYEGDKPGWVMACAEAGIEVFH